MFRQSCSLFSLACAVCAGVVLMVTSPSIVLAQGRGGMRMNMGMGAGTSARVATDDFNSYLDMLELTTDQREAAKALFDTYSAEYDQATEDFQKAMSKARAEFDETRDPAVWQETMPKAGSAFTEKVGKLDTSFMSDLKSVLTAEQSAKWPSVERARRRDSSLPSGMLSGESMDLTKVVHDLKINGPLPESVAQPLARYETELDQAIQERDARRKELAEQMPNFGQRAGGGGGGASAFDPQAMMKIVGDMRKSGLKVRDLNDRYASLLESAMPEGHKSAFGDKIRLAKYPQVYREPYTLKAIGAVEKFKDLDEPNRKSLQELKDQYTREVAALNATWAKAIGDEEKEGGGDLMTAGWARMMGGDDSGDSPQQIARRARRELDKTTLDKVKALLTPEQQEKLPERDMQPGWGGFGGGRGR